MDKAELEAHIAIAILAGERYCRECGASPSQLVTLSWAWVCRDLDNGNGKYIWVFATAEEAIAQFELHEARQRCDGPRYTKLTEPARWPRAWLIEYEPVPNCITPHYWRKR